MSRASTLATAVAAAISAGSPTGSPSVALAYLPVFDREGQSAAAAKIQVYVAGTEWTIENRCPNATMSYLIGVAFFEYLAPVSGSITNASVATMLDLVEEVAGDIIAAEISGYRLTEVTQQQPFDFQSLHDSGIFETTLTLRYKGK